MQGRAFLVLLAALLTARATTAADRPLHDANIVLTRSASGRQRLVFTSRDTGFLFPFVGGADDPSVSGASVTLITPVGPAVTMTLPGGVGNPGWRVNDTASLDAYRFINGAAPSALSAVHRLSLRQGRTMKIVVRPTATLARPLGSLGVRLTAGSLRNCALFDAPTVRVDQPGRFIARVAAPGTLLDCSDVALGARRPTVWLFGDSITGLYCHRVQEQHVEWDVVCLGLGSETTVLGATRLSQALAAATTKPDVVLIEEGVNDLIGLIYDYDQQTQACTTDPLPQPQNVNARLSGIADMVRAAGGTPIVSTLLYLCPVPNGDTCLALPPSEPGACPWLRCFFDGACALSTLIMETQNPWVDFVIPVDRFFDVLHPDAAGEQVLADKAAAAIAVVLSTAPAS